MKPCLQVALDFINGDRALQIAADAVAGGVDWIEAGTPLIKSEGLSIVRKLRKQFPRHTLVADMKVMDTGALETEIAAKAGANIICLLGAADNSTIADAVKAARKYSAEIMVDLLGVADIKKRVQDLESLGVDYLCVHVGIDEQMMGKQPIKPVQQLVKITTLPVAVAGGLNSETVVDVINAGASIVIVGGAITKAHDVKKATQTIKQAMTSKTKVPTDLYKKYDVTELKQAFSQVSTPNISDAMHRKGAMTSITPINKGHHIAGPALTVKTMDGDWAKPIEAIDQCTPGTILVVDTNGGTTAIWGELATWSAKKQHLEGVVIDGAVRDIDDIRKIDYPIFCRHQVVNAGEPKGLGEIGGEIICGGQSVRTGDWIIGDDSGIVVVPKEQAQEIANRALDVKEHENRIREEIKQGKTLNSVVDVEKWEKIVG